MDALLLASIILGAYLLGGIPFGYLVGRWRGIDIFQHGSGNIGATNVGRVLGRKYGILVFLLDFGKGALAVVVAMVVKDHFGYTASEIFVRSLPIVAGMAAFLGHMFPVYLHFRGGKGVATGAGVVAVLMPIPFLGALLAWLGVVCATRYVSLASLTGAVALCVFHFSWSEAPLADENFFTSLFCLVAAGLVAARHHTNLVRLLAGNENRLPETATMAKLGKIIHVLALGLWFGSACFFMLIVAGSLFATFEDIGANAEARPKWFPLSKEFSHEDSQVNGPREQGARAAGVAVAPLFAWFFLVQGACGFLATATALGWSKLPDGKVHRIRSRLLLAALVLVLVGWPVERHVSALRGPRNQAIDRYLTSAPPARDAALDQMKAAKGEFATWHLVSLALGLTTLMLVTVAMALAARLPSSPVAKDAPSV